MDLAILWVDLGPQIHLDVVGGLLGLGVAGECELVGLEVQLHVLGGDIGDGDGEEDVVALWIT